MTYKIIEYIYGPCGCRQRLETRDTVDTNTETESGWLRVFYKLNPKAPRKNYSVWCNADGASIYSKLHGDYSRLRLVADFEKVLDK